MTEGLLMFLLLAFFVAVLTSLAVARNRRQRRIDNTARSAADFAVPSSPVVPFEERISGEMHDLSNSQDSDEPPMFVLQQATSAPEASAYTVSQHIATGETHMADRSFDDAIESFFAALALIAEEESPLSIDFAETLIKLDDAYLERDLANVSADFRCDNYLLALGIIERTFGPQDESLVPLLEKIITVYLLSGQPNEAESLMLRVQRIKRINLDRTLFDGLESFLVNIEVVDGSRDLDSGIALLDGPFSAGVLAQRHGQYDKATELLLAVLENARNDLGSTSLKLVPILVKLAETLYLQILVQDADTEITVEADPLAYARLALALLVRERGLAPGSDFLLLVLLDLIAFNDRIGAHAKANQYLEMLENIATAGAHPQD